MITDVVPYSMNPPRLLADANFNEHIVRGLRRKRPDMTLETAHQMPLGTAPDPELLAIAAQCDLILLTHNVRTIPQHFATFLMQSDDDEFSPGVWYVAQALPVGGAIDTILEAWLCSDLDEYRNRELWLP